MVVGAKVILQVDIYKLERNATKHTIRLYHLVKVLSILETAD